MKFISFIMILMIGISVVFTQNTVAMEMKLNPSMNLVKRLIDRGDYDRAMTFLLLLEETAEDPRDQYASVLLQSHLYEASKKNETAIRLLDDFQRRSNWDKEYTRLLVYEKVRLAMLQGHSTHALFYTSELIQRLPDVEKDLKNRILTAQKDIDMHSDKPSWAYGLSSAMLPGLGQVLLSRYTDAVSSIFMLSIPCYITYLAKKEDEKSIYQAGIFVSSLFYLGNISLAYNLSEQQNSKARGLLRTSLIDMHLPKVRLHFDRESTKFELRWPL